jgi:hypothetical protein
MKHVLREAGTYRAPLMVRMSTNNEHAPAYDATLAADLTGSALMDCPFQAPAQTS